MLHRPFIIICSICFIFRILPVILQDSFHSCVMWCVEHLVLYVISGWLKTNVERTIHYPSSIKTFGSLTCRRFLFSAIHPLLMKMLLHRLCQSCLSDQNEWADKLCPVYLFFVIESVFSDEQAEDIHSQFSLFELHLSVSTLT